MVELSPELKVVVEAHTPGGDRTVLKLQLAEELARIDLSGSAPTAPNLREIVRIIDDYGDEGAILMEKKIPIEPNPMFPGIVERELSFLEHFLDKLVRSVHLNEFLHEIVTKFPSIRNRESNACSRVVGMIHFPHVVLSNLRCAISNEVLGLIVDSDNATLVSDINFETPLYAACWNARFALTSPALVRISAEALKIADVEDCLPLHSACRKFRDYLKLDPTVFRTLLDLYPEALVAENERERLTPVILAVTSIVGRLKPRQEATAAAALSRMVRLAPTSVRCVSHELDAYTTLLDTVCMHFPHVELLSEVVRAWPVALVHSTRNLHLPTIWAVKRLPCTTVREYGLASEATNRLVRAETLEVFAALVEVMLDLSLQDSLSEVAQDLREKIRAELAWFEDLNVTPYTARLLRTRLLAGDGDEHVRIILETGSLQKALFENQSLCDMVCGLYRMNKAGRANSLLAQSSIHHARILEAAGDNLDSVFFHLRNGPFPSLANQQPCGRMRARKRRKMR